MDEQVLKSIASQLRQPHGENGRQVGEKMNEGNLYINQFTIEQLQPQQNDQILEIGMGNGFFIKDVLAADPSVKYTGCDFSETMLEEASKINKQDIDSGRVMLVLADAQNLPFNDCVFSKVFTINTVYFWESPALVLSEIRRVLISGGKLLVSLRPESQMKNYPFVKYGFTTYSKESLSALLSQNGFIVESITEKSEPEQELLGEKMIVESLIITARKS